MKIIWKEGEDAYYLNVNNLIVEKTKINKIDIKIHNNTTTIMLNDREEMFYVKNKKKAKQVIIKYFSDVMQANKNALKARRDQMLNNLNEIN